MATGELSPSVIRGVNTRQLNNTTMANRSVIELLRNMLKPSQCATLYPYFLTIMPKRVQKILDCGLFSAPRFCYPRQLPSSPNG